MRENTKQSAIILPFLLIGSALLGASPQSVNVYSDAERSQIQQFWASSGRYGVGLPPDAAVKGPWQIRVTPDGSLWLWKYQTAIGARGLPPTQTPELTATMQANQSNWKGWVQAKIAHDRWKAQCTADSANRACGSFAPTSINATNRNLTRPADSSGTVGRAVQTNNEPLDPGPIPPTLLAAVSNPPCFAYAVTPMLHTIKFDDGEVFSYTDNVAVPSGYASYRSPQGVAFSGPQIQAGVLDSLFSGAGMNASEQRIARSVSKLEGSFESVNTYDTGFVSVGFIQFITLDDGKHSLCDVLKLEKLERPADFTADFHTFGIELTADGVIDVVDPATGAELIGPEAVHKIVDDKRLIAIFQRAGRHSDAFRTAQVKIALQKYWPSNDSITCTIGNKPVMGKVSDVIKSEAGIATLFDRKVNRGSCEPISAIVNKVIKDHKLAKLTDAAKYEREIVQQLKYRVDFLSDITLQQPKLSGATDE